MGAVEPVRPRTVPSLLAPRTLRAVRDLSRQAPRADSPRALLVNLPPVQISVIRTSPNSSEEEEEVVVEVVEVVVEVIPTTP